MSFQKVLEMLTMIYSNLCNRCNANWRIAMMKNRDCSKTTDCRFGNEMIVLSLALLIHIDRHFLRHRRFYVSLLARREISSRN